MRPRLSVVPFLVLLLAASACQRPPPVVNVQAPPCECAIWLTNMTTICSTLILLALR